MGKTVSREKPREVGRGRSPRALKTGLMLREDMPTWLSMLVPIVMAQGLFQTSIYTEYHYRPTPHPFFFLSLEGFSAGL